MKINPIVVDISHHQPSVDFKKAHAAGIRGVIHKATEGATYVDPQYQRRRGQAREAGLLWGAYHFFRPSNVNSQVDWFLKVADPDQDMLLALDHEDPNCNVQMVKQFLTLVEQRTGRKAALYSGHLIKEQLGTQIDSHLGQHRLWLAQYGTKPVVQGSWKAPWLWQFTGDGKGPAPHSVDGIGKNVDINSFEGTEQNLREQWSGLAGATVPAPVPPQPRPPETPAPSTVAVKQYNVLAFAGLGTSHSAGLQDILMRLGPWQGDRKPIDFTKFIPYEEWKSWADQIAYWSDDTIFLCHSYGVAGVMGLIRRMGSSGPRIPLIISFDPSQYVWMDPKLWGSGGNAVPQRAIEVHNFWQEGWPIGYQRLAREDGSTTGIVNEEVDATHTGIDDRPYTQSKALRMIKQKTGIPVL